MASINERVNDRYLRPILRDLVSQCTKAQQGKFDRAFGSVDEVPTEKIPSAIALCERTIKRNQERIE